MPITADQAVAAVAATEDEPADGHFVASKVDGSPLWSVRVEDSQGRPAAGGGWLVGPDARVFLVSSNPWIHESGLAERLLRAIYEDGVEDAVDPAIFADRLRRLTEDRKQLVRAVVAEAKAGSLRVASRWLP